MSRINRLPIVSQLHTRLDSDALTIKSRAIVQPELMVESAMIPRQTKTDGALVLHGRLLIHDNRFFSRWIEDFRHIGYTPVLRQDDEEGDHVSLHVMSGIPVTTQPQVWLNIALFVVTFLSTLFAGASYGATDAATVVELLYPQYLIQGLPFALTLLGILGSHEFGHYFAARYHRVAVSLPYFIPMPLGFGTLGAVIRMKEPVPDRRKLFDIAVAGPLAGLTLAIPLLLYGLSTSPILVPEPAAGAMLEGNSLLYYYAKISVFGKALPNPLTGEDVLMNQVTFAAWIGLLVTAINLLPVGQLDGGHAVYALFGKHARYVNIATIATMTVLAIAGLSPLQELFPPLVSVGYTGWFVWLALLMFLVGPFHPPALDDVSKLDVNRRLIGYLVIFIFIMIFVPVPFRPLS